MNTVSAVYFDGLNSRPHPVELRFNPAGTLEIIGDGVHLQAPRHELGIDPPLGRTNRFIRLAQGGRCEVSDLAALEQALAHWRPSRGSLWLHQVEKNWPLVLVSVLVLACLGWIVIRHGLPWGARKIAFALPADITRKLGSETLAAFDKTMFQPSRLAAERRTALQRKFREFLDQAGAPAVYRIEFRRSEVFGANAFALPSGDIVITDGLVELAEDDREIVGVLAHECGHVVHRHALRSVLQNSSVFVVIALVTGDVSSATAFGGALPAYLMESKYSREFETEADLYAVQLMRAAKVDPVHLANMLKRLSSQSHDSSGKALSYFSTHPLTAERIKAITSTSATVPPETTVHK